MRRLVDQCLVGAVQRLRAHPKAFRLAKHWFSDTLAHRILRSAKQNVALRRLSGDAARTLPVATGQRDASEHWDKHVALVESGELKGWLDWEFVEVEHIRPQVSGDRGIYYLQHFFRSHLPSMPVKRALSLGCGGGNLERALIQLNAAQCIDAFDASPESIRVATHLAEEAGSSGRIRYAVENINRLRLERGAYDFVIAKMSLHHFEDLDHIFSEVRQALKPGGVFVFNEYVGPNRFQWSDLQLALVNRVLEVLPERHRRSALTGARLDRIVRPTVQEMIDLDPTEAVRSAEILPALGRHFEVLERRDYGGTLLHLLLNHVMADFDVKDELQASLLRMIFLLERTLVEHKVLASDFSYVVARPLPGA